MDGLSVLGDRYVVNLLFFDSDRDGAFLRLSTVSCVSALVTTPCTATYGEAHATACSCLIFFAFVTFRWLEDTDSALRDSKES